MALKKTKETKILDPIHDGLDVESDTKVMAFVGVCLLIGLLISFLAGTYEVVVDEVLFTDAETASLSATMKIEMKKEEKKDTKKPDKKSDKIRKKAGGGGGQPRGKGNPNAPQSRGVLKLLTARSSKANYSAYTLMKDQKFAKDIDKVLKNVAGLQKSGTTVLGGRRGKADGGFNEGYAEGGSGGIGDMLGGLLGGSSGGISTKAKGSVRAPTERDIDMGSGGGSRSQAEIMQVVRSRMPGLRHIYNKFLKTRPGFSGKVTLQFTIAPGGDIISIKMVSSTTGYDEFDSEVQEAVQTWRFKVIKSGNVTCTLPFSFSE